ncbi:hypothetical protein RE428_32310 [Marinobacter nanhaiticus D15-8W]|uniref:Uncharacterized protein n=1 Tax=Marinobacter nanhaiticus D15-8W TaxID=626887 RepID=N6WZD6_9GAMM|nr:hypothetical protein [Marinobacter nanhaiticus]ENO16921.1 hypothetical protein J057_01915 [Marinobacter nanhaiticus D15-8W]BES72213.1 hypothetical protein RE428_32310 [Marinobacter nanhaiticus D15-8W]
MSEKAEFEVKVWRDDGEGRNRIQVFGADGFHCGDTGEPNSKDEELSCTLKNLYYAIERIADLENQLQARASADSDGKRNNAEPVAYRVTGSYTNQPFRDESTARRYCRGLLSSDPEGGYEVEPLYPDPAQGREQWVYCSYRLPSLAHPFDCWYSADNDTPVLLSPESVAKNYGYGNAPRAKWMCSGLKRPNPPQPQPSGEDEREE